MTTEQIWRERLAQDSLVKRGLWTVLYGLGRVLSLFYWEPLKTLNQTAPNPQNAEQQNPVIAETTSSSKNILYDYALFFFGAPQPLKLALVIGATSDECDTSARWGRYFEKKQMLCQGLPTYIEKGIAFFDAQYLEEVNYPHLLQRMLTSYQAYYSDYIKNNFTKNVYFSTNITNRAMQNLLNHGAEKRTRTSTGLPPLAPEASVSTIPPPRQSKGKLRKFQVFVNF